MKKDIAVIGLGTFGYELAVQLAQEGHHILAIDMDMKIVNDIKDQVDVAIQADITDPDVLKKLQIDQFDHVILAMSSALEAIILGITYMKKMKVKNIIGKANTHIQKEILLKIGADEVILPEIATAKRLAERITHPGIVEKFNIDNKNALVEVKIPKKFHHKSIRELDLRKKYGLNVIMINRNGKTEMISSPDIQFEPGDVILVVGDERQIKKTLFD